MDAESKRLGRCPAQHAARAERVAKYEKRSEASITTAASKDAESKRDSRPLEKFFSDLEALELKKHTKVLREIEKLEKLPKLDKLQLEKVGCKQGILKTTVMVKKAAGACPTSATSQAPARPWCVSSAREPPSLRKTSPMGENPACFL